MMNFRQEKKIDIVYPSLGKLFSYLSNNGFKKSYRDRKVNSYYFDTINLSMHKQSEEGTIPRKKIRIRWYDEISKSKFFLEKKISLSDKRFKSSSEIKLSDFKNFKKKGIFDNQHGLCYPKILVSYNRSYFQNSLFRVTVDTDILYKKFNLISDNRVIIDKKPVMEIKYNSDVSQSCYEKIFFFKEIRFSKYSRGINYLINYLTQNQLN